MKFSYSESLIILILHRSNRLLIHWWLISIASLLSLPYSQIISTAKEDKHLIHLYFRRAQYLIGAQWAAMELTCMWPCQLEFKLHFERSRESLEIFDEDGSGWHDLMWLHIASKWGGLEGEGDTPIEWWWCLAVAGHAGLIGKVDNMVDKHEYFGLSRGENSNCHLCQESRWPMKIDTVFGSRKISGKFFRLPFLLGFFPSEMCNYQLISITKLPKSLAR